MQDQMYVSSNENVNETRWDKVLQIYFIIKLLFPI